jgi:hypothetical protein
MNSLSTVRSHTRLQELMILITGVEHEGPPLCGRDMDTK